ncbi:MAG: hypothetical protein WBQ69_12050 [Gallionella sp.]
MNSSDLAKAIAAEILSGSSVWLFLLLTAFVAGTGAYFGKYLGAKAANLATKEDIGDITRKVENIKVEYSRQMEELKDSLSQKQDFIRTKNAAILELTKKLAARSHSISWLTWAATQDEVSIDEEDFNSYDKEMMVVSSDLLALLATVAALDEEKYKVLRP